MAWKPVGVWTSLSPPMLEGVSSMDEKPSSMSPRVHHQLVAASLRPSAWLEPKKTMPPSSSTAMAGS